MEGRRKQRPKKEERGKGGAEETEEPRGCIRTQGEAELATLGWRKDFKRTATEAKTTATDTFHTRTVFQRSATGEDRHCFLSLPLSPLSVDCKEHKPRDHGFDPSVSLRVLPHLRPGATTLQLYSTDQKRLHPPAGRGAVS